MGRCELAVGGERCVAQVPPPGGILPRLERARRLAPDDDEGAPVGARLEQHGVHCGGRLEASGLRLLRLEHAVLIDVDDLALHAERTGICR